MNKMNRQCVAVLSSIAGLFSLGFLTNEAFSADPIVGISTLSATRALRANIAMKALGTNSLLNSVLADPRNEISEHSLETYDGVTTLKYAHKFNGVEVYGSRIFHHETDSAEQVSQAIAPVQVDTSPRIKIEDAVAIAKGQFSESLFQRGLQSRPILRILPQEDPHVGKLIYVVQLGSEDMDGGYEAWVNAHDGSVIGFYQLMHTIAPHRTLSANENCQQVGTRGEPISLALGKCKVELINGKAMGPVVDPHAVKAARNHARVLQYYLSVHRRNSFDGMGGASQSLVHLGNKYNNAGWFPTLRMMGYGDGDGVRMKPLTEAVDVAGHEMTHAVISETANFGPFDEQGAANEAFADFFGVMVANNNNWNIGQSIFVNPKMGPIRCIADPHSCKFNRPGPNGTIVSKPYPKHMKEKLPRMKVCNDGNDRCWVHINSPILSHAFYWIHQSVGRKVAEKLLYVTMTQYLRESSGFADVSARTKEACSLLFPKDVCTRVSKSFAVVGL